MALVETMRRAAQNLAREPAFGAKRRSQVEAMEAMLVEGADEIERLQQKVQNLMDDLTASEDDLADATEKPDDRT